MQATPSLDDEGFKVLHPRFKLQEKFFVFRIVDGPVVISACKFFDTVQRIPGGDGAEVRHVFVHRSPDVNADDAGSGAVVAGAFVKEKIEVSIRFFFKGDSMPQAGNDRFHKTSFLPKLIEQSIG